MSADYTRDAIVAAARNWIGTPYRHQASLRWVGTDCLGLIRGVYRELHGADPELPPPYSADWAEMPGADGHIHETMAAAARRHLEEITPENAVPGDVLLFRMMPRAAAKHAAFQSAPGRMIHACSGRAVAEVHMGPWWRRRLVYAFRFPGISL